MEDTHFIPNRDDEYPKRSMAKIFGLLVVGLFVGTSVIGGSYYLGRQSVQGAKTENTYTPLSESIVNSPTLVPTEEPEVKAASTSGTPTNTPTVSGRTLLLQFTHELSGTKGSSESALVKPGIVVGRDTEGVYRGFVSFNLGSLKEGASVTKATLRLYQEKTVGNPYAIIGSIKSDHLIYGETLDQTDYAIAALSSSFGILSDNEKTEWKEIDVTSRVKADIANARTYSQYRLHGTTENKSQQGESFVHFSSQSPNAPQLVIVYN